MPGERRQRKWKEELFFLLNASQPAGDQRVVSHHWKRLEKGHTAAGYEGQAHNQVSHLEEQLNVKEKDLNRVEELLFKGWREEGLQTAAGDKKKLSRRRIWIEDMALGVIRTRNTDGRRIAAAQDGQQ